MRQTPNPAPNAHVQDFRALVREMRQRLMLTTEQFAKRLKETPTTVSQWQYSANPTTIKTRAQLKKVLLEMGDLGKDLLEEYYP